jgi:hypothetical protein
MRYKGKILTSKIFNDITEIFELIFKELFINIYISAYLEFLGECKEKACCW